MTSLFGPVPNYFSHLRKYIFMKWQIFDLAKINSINEVYMALKFSNVKALFNRLGIVRSGKSLVGEFLVEEMFVGKLSGRGVCHVTLSFHFIQKAYQMYKNIATTLLLFTKAIFPFQREYRWWSTLFADTWFEKIAFL